MCYYLMSFPLLMSVFALFLLQPALAWTTFRVGLYCGFFIILAIAFILSGEQKSRWHSLIFLMLDFFKSRKSCAAVTYLFRPTLKAAWLSIKRQWDFSMWFGIIAENNLWVKQTFMTRLVQQDTLHISTPLYDFWSKKLTLGYKGTTAQSHDFTSPPLS